MNINVNILTVFKFDVVVLQAIPISTEKATFIIKNVLSGAVQTNSLTCSFLNTFAKVFRIAFSLLKHVSLVVVSASVLRHLANYYIRHIPLVYGTSFF